MKTSGSTTVPATLRFDVAIRVDASTSLGAGHVLRCLALANELREEGHRVLFVMREAPGDLRDVIVDREGYSVVMLPPASDAELHHSHETTDAQQMLAALDGRRPDWIIVDHYGLGARWELAVAKSSAQVLAIDDHGSRTHACAIVVDHNLLPESTYAAITTPGTDVLLGPRYALLHRNIGALTASAATSERLETVVVSFGGTDPTGQTARALHALRYAKCAPKRVIAVAGRDNPNLEKLRNMARDWPALEVHEFVDDIAALLVTADLAVGAGGVSALERLAMGIPSIVLATARNQERPSEGLAAGGAILYLGPAGSIAADAITTAIDTMTNRHLRSAMRRRGTALVDGFGTKRVLRAMRQRTHLSIRLANRQDRRYIHAWRNHPSIRRTALDSTEIPWVTHDGWFDNVLTDPDRHLLVVEFRGTPIGVVRYDLDRSRGSAEVSIFLAPEYLGLGLGRPSLNSANAWLAVQEPGVQHIEAQVLGANARSLRLFESAGFIVRRTLLRLEQSATATTPDGAPQGGT